MTDISLDRQASSSNSEHFKFFTFFVATAAILKFLSLKIMCTHVRQNFWKASSNSEHIIIYLNVRNILVNESLFRKLLQLLNIRPSENSLLFGSSDLDIDSNTIVFTTVHKYIVQLTISFFFFFL